MVVKININNTPKLLDVNDNETLLETLRNRLHLTGTKRGCESGECGACTVLVNGEAVVSCLYLTLEAAGKSVTTIEGLAGAKGPHIIQKAFVEKGAIHCGFCTPGMVLTAKALLDKNPTPSREEIKKAIEGNVCRCTGYQQIIDAIEYASKLLADQED